MGDNKSVSRRLVAEWYRPWVKWVIIAFVLLPPYVGVANFVGRFTGAVVVVFLLTVVWRAFMLVVQPAVPDFDMSGHARQIGRWIGRRL